MPRLKKLVVTILFGCVPLYAQNGSSAPQQGDPSVQPNQSSQPAAEGNKKAPADQATPSSSENSTKLEAIKTVKAPYPYEAREKQLQGQVWVKILVSETGDVESAEIVSGDPVLADAAVKAVKKWKFKPFLKNGQPVKVSTKLPFNFAFSENVHVEKLPPAAENAPAIANPPASGESANRVRISQGVSQGLLLYKVAPVYPIEARRAHIQGTVLLQAIINTEGRIRGLTLISGPKELAPAAIGAVQQWTYRPYLLMGNPVEVETQIQVNFKLAY